MQDMCANSNEGMVLVVSLEQGEGRGGGGGNLENPPDFTQIWVHLFQNFQFKFDIAWFVFSSLAQKEVSNLLHRYVVVSTPGTHNPCHIRYLLHMSLCLSITQAIVLSLAYIILIIMIPTMSFWWFCCRIEKNALLFSDWINGFWIGGYFLKTCFQNSSFKQS